MTIMAIVAAVSVLLFNGNPLPEEASSLRPVPPAKAPGTEPRASVQPVPFEASETAGKAKQESVSALETDTPLIDNSSDGSDLPVLSVNLAQGAEQVARETDNNRVEPEQPVLAANNQINSRNSAEESGQEMVPADQEDLALNKIEFTEYERTPIVLRESELIELSDDELLSLGLERVETGIRMFEYGGNNTEIVKTFDMNGASFRTRTVDKKRPFYAAPYIRFVTDNTGSRRMSRFEDDDEADAQPDNEAERTGVIIFLPNYDNPDSSLVIEAASWEEFKHTEPRLATRQEILEFEESNKASKESDPNINEYVRANNLLPIIVRSNREYTAEDEANKRWRPDLILWVEPAEELLAHLPRPVRAPDANSADGSMRRRAAEEASLAGSISDATVFPNPAFTPKVTLRCTLKEGRTLGVSLYNLVGEFIAEVAAPRAAPSGEWQASADLSGIPAGMYLVAFRSARGEQVIQRLIVEK